MPDGCFGACLDHDCVIPGGLAIALDSHRCTQHGLEESAYPIRSVTGIARWHNNELVLASSVPHGRLNLNESAAAILLSCDGICTTKELVYAIQAQYPAHSRSSVVADIYGALAELADNTLIRFSRVQAEPVPVIRARFHDCPPGLDVDANYFTRMMAAHMLTIIVDDGTSDVVFQWIHGPGSSVAEPEDDDCVRVFVSNGWTRPDFHRFDFAFSPFPVEDSLTSLHGRISREACTGQTRSSVDKTVSRKFYDFLFPVDRDEFRFSFGDTEEGSDTPVSGLPCDPPTSAASPEEPDSDFHVCLVSDRAQAQGLFALVNSILANTKTPERFCFHVLVDSNPVFYETAFSSRFKIFPRCEIKSFTTTREYQKYVDFIEAYMRVEGGARESGRITNTMNFARIYLPELFPDVDVALYLDVDMIVQTDLNRLRSVNMASNIVAAPLNRNFDHYHAGLELRGKGFNAGFLLMNFRRWREKGVTRAIEKVIVKHKQRRLFSGGTQSLLNVVFYQQCVDLNHLWNVTDLGFREDLDPELLEEARILHWNGGRKPWLDDGLYKNLWDGYRVPLPTR